MHADAAGVACPTRSARDGSAGAGRAGDARTEREWNANARYDSVRASDAHRRGGPSNRNRSDRDTGAGNVGIAGYRRERSRRDAAPRAHHR